jgi:hypothetical protein
MTISHHKQACVSLQSVCTSPFLPDLPHPSRASSLSPNTSLVCPMKFPKSQVASLARQPCTSSGSGFRTQAFYNYTNEHTRTHRLARRYTHTETSTYTHNETHSHTHNHTHVCHTRTHTYINISTHAHTYVHRYQHAQTGIHAHTQTHRCTCVHTYSLPPPPPTCTGARRQL